jgi:hypothetical protein
MKSFLIALLIVTAACHSAFSQDSRAKEIDWASKQIEVITVEDKVKIVLQTGGQAGRRLIQTGFEAFSNRPFATLTYQVLQNSAESYRNMELVHVTWTIPKAEFDKLRAERKFYILRHDDISLSPDEVKEIQKTWKAD